ncbi:hypothetical protein [Novosphingobium mangrovi (ex Hu et al. 2023)]|uniref:Uncharacterized protein n=1 Tax=Novosphingobium mangrovi (ex Hu et al. 2023) TaxID=2930094 RepID=A0ABT0AET4_9SPHN|nr:hypothetical protein [Novosphingobium mangrovi (ex Hu et al. 2023)]MCJ1961710.1 hypothetical protein [Novosphingobium mangrovi (ex Hu et al. 2023)]
MPRASRPVRTRLLMLAASLALFAGLGVLAFERLGTESVASDITGAPIYAITQTGNHILVEVVSPILY